MKFLMKMMAIFAMTKLPELAEDDYRFTAADRAQLALLSYNEDEIVAIESQFNDELKAVNAVKTELDDARAQLASLQESVGLKKDEITKDGLDPGGGQATQANPELNLTDQLKAVQAKVTKLKADNDLLSAKDLPAPAVFKNANMKNLVHSNTHFLGTGATWDAIADRPWNAQAVAGSTVASTDWGDSNNLELLKGDAEHYARQNPTTIDSLFRDVEGYPSFWKTRFDVSDRVVGASIVTGEVTQARKRSYLPKTKQKIQTEVGYVFPVNIDLTFSGYDLQQIETSWLNMWNKEGTSPFKMHFVTYLLVEISKQARLEDRYAGIKGIYSPIPDGLEIPGKAEERMNGLLKTLWDGIYVDGKVKTVNQSEPTAANMYFHVKDTILKNLKEEVINEPNLVYYLSASHMRLYRLAYRREFGVQMDFTGETESVKDHENIKLCVLRDLEGSNIHIITFDDNIEPMENRANEKNIYRFDLDKRDMHVFGDYKTGIRFKQLGTKVADGDPVSFKVQSVWTNGQPLFAPTHNVTVYDDTTGIVNVPFSDVRVMSGWATDIVDITGGYPGMVLKLRGNSSAASGTAVKANAKLLIGTDFLLRADATLFLLKNNNGTWKQIKRTTNAPVTPEGAAVTFTSNAIDSNDGANFSYIGTTAQSLTSISNAVEGRKVTITQSATGAGRAFTIPNIAGNVSVASAAVLDTAADFVEFTVIDGVFTETNRTIA